MTVSQTKPSVLYSLNTKSNQTVHAIGLYRNTSDRIAAIEVHKQKPTDSQCSFKILNPEIPTNDKYILFQIRTADNKNEVDFILKNTLKKELITIQDKWNVMSEAWEEISRFYLHKFNIKRGLILVDFDVFFSSVCMYEELINEGKISLEPLKIVM